MFWLGNPDADKFYTAFIAELMTATEESKGSNQDLTPLMNASYIGEAHSY